MGLVRVEKKQRMKWAKKWMGEKIVKGGLEVSWTFEQRRVIEEE